MFTPELSRFLKDKGWWKLQSTVVRKGRGEFLTILLHYCALGLPSSLFWIWYTKPKEFRNILSFFGPPLKRCTYPLSYNGCKHTYEVYKHVTQNVPPLKNVSPPRVNPPKAGLPSSASPLFATSCPHHAGRPCLLVGNICNLVGENSNHVVVS